MSINSRNGNTLLDGGSFSPVRAATTEAITLAELQTVDGVALANGDRVLVKDQADQTTNGIYAASSGNWVRTTDAQSNTDFFSGMAVSVAPGGVVNAGRDFMCTCADDPVVVGTSLLTFASQSDVQQAQQSATSTTSAPLALGAQTFSVESGKSLFAKQWVLISETSNPDNRMLAEITSYSGGSLVVNVVAVGGSGGPYSDWSIALTNSPAAAGRQPPIGTGNMSGPGVSVAGDLVVFLDTGGKNTADSGIKPGTLAGRNSLLYGDAGSASVPAAALAIDVLRGPLMATPGVSENFLLANDGTNPTRDVSVGAGRCEDDGGAAKTRLKGAMLKRLDTAWAAGGSAGAPAGGCDSGGTKAASKTLHCYVIGKPGLSVTQFSRTSNVATLTITGHGLGAGGTLDVEGVGNGLDGSQVLTAVTTNTLSFANTGADVGATACSGTATGFDALFSRQDANAYPSPAMPSGWTLKQCLGSVLTDGSANVIAFSQVGNEFLLVNSVANINNSAPGDSAGHLVALTVPLGVKVGAILNFWANNVGAYASSPDQADEAVSNTPPPLFTVGAPPAETSVRIDGLRTNTSGQIRYRLSSNGDVSVVSLGWRDPRRRLF